MKHLSILAASTISVATLSGASAATSHLYANNITAHNIAAIQDTVTSGAFRAFSGSMGTILGNQSILAARATRANEDPSKTYGRAPMYGTASIYGEYNDDGTAGRNGGDIINADAALNNVWINWQHIGDDVKFDEFERLDSDFDVAMFGISGGTSEMMGGISKWGIYAGHINGDQDNSTIKIDEHGGFFGIYNGNIFGNLGLYASLNGGVLNNTVTSTYGIDELSNFWAAGTISATYDFALDRTFTIQPGLHTGYTWIKSENYTSASGDIVKNDAFSMLEITPALRAIKHIGNGWFGSLNLKHVMIFANGGNLTVNDVATETLETNNYTEYSISLEKSVSHMNVSATFGRHDGARDGWIGGINIKYMF